MVQPIDSETQRELAELAHSIFGLLARGNQRLVLAESCTGGLVAATLVQVPGVSQYLLGSAVTYHEHAKQQWLDIPASLIENHTAVSAEVTQAMARQVLRHTPLATCSLAITGHLDSVYLAESENDQARGVVLVEYANRDPSQQAGAQDKTLPVSLYGESRLERQWEATAHALRQLAQCLAHHDESGQNTTR